ncbi:MAG: hypothetical protein ACYDCC_02370 [Actinomycetota bacterium]
MPVRPATRELLHAAFPDAGSIKAGGPVEAPARIAGMRALEHAKRSHKETFSGEWIAADDGLYLVLEEMPKPIRFRWSEIERATRSGGLLTSWITLHMKDGREHRIKTGRAAASKIESWAVG